MIERGNRDRLRLGRPIGRAVGGRVGSRRAPRAARGRAAVRAGPATGPAEKGRDRKQNGRRETKRGAVQAHRRCTRPRSPQSQRRARPGSDPANNRFAERWRTELSNDRRVRRRDAHGRDRGDRSGTPPPAVRERQLGRHLPRSARRADRRPTAATRPPTATTPGPRRSRRASATVPDRLRSLLRVQRHGGQLAGARVAVPVVPRGDLPRTRARRNRRMRRPRILLRRHRSCSRRPARTASSHPRASTRVVDAPRRHPLSEAEGRQRSRRRRKSAPSTPSRKSRAIAARSPSATSCSVHMDGARFANAVAALGVHPAEITWQRGRRRAVLRRHEERPAGRARRSCSSTRRSPPNSRTAASRRGSSPRRCASSPRHGSACSTTDAWLRNARHAQRDGAADRRAPRRRSGREGAVRAAGERGVRRAARASSWRCAGAGGSSTSSSARAAAG